MTELTAATPHIHRLVIPFLDIFTTCFIVNTEEGIVLIDTATYPTDVDDYIVPALQELGVQPEQLKYAVITHNHRDHAGGLERFAQLFPQTVIVAGSNGCETRIPGKTVQVMEDGQTLLGPLKKINVPVH